MVSKIIARFEPILEMKYPSDRLPHIPPSAFIEPIHEISSFVRGPDSKNVFSFDDKMGNAGDWDERENETNYFEYSEEISIRISNSSNQPSDSRSLRKINYTDYNRSEILIPCGGPFKWCPRSLSSHHHSNMKCKCHLCESSGYWILLWNRKWLLKLLYGPRIKAQIDVKYVINSVWAVCMQKNTQLSIYSLKIRLFDNQKRNLRFYLRLTYSHKSTEQ